MRGRRVPRILLVEDDATIGDVLTTSLRSQAYNVTWERTGAAALALPRPVPSTSSCWTWACRPRGTEVRRLLRRAQPGCVLVILTARSAEMDVGSVGLRAPTTI